MISISNGMLGPERSNQSRMVSAGQATVVVFSWIVDHSFGSCSATRLQSLLTADNCQPHFLSPAIQMRRKTSARSSSGSFRMGAKLEGEQVRRESNGEANAPRLKGINDVLCLGLGNLDC